MRPMYSCPEWETSMVDLCIGQTVCDIKFHDVVRAGISADRFHDKCPREGTKQPQNTSEKATELCMLEVIADSQL